MIRGSYGVIAVGAALLLSGAGDVSAQVEFTGNASVLSDYTYRGISQTLEEPAVQGGIDASLPEGVYVGVWGSSVNFGEDLAGGARAQVELDVYGGIARSVGGFDVDLGALYYAYPGAADSRNYNFFELGAGLGRAFGPVSVGLNGAWSPDFYAGSGTGLYGAGSLSFGVPSTPVSLDGSVGYQSIEKNDIFGTPDYLSWNVGASVQVYGLGIGAGLTGTDLSEDDCFGGSELCGTRFVVSVGI